MAAGEAEGKPSGVPASQQPDVVTVPGNWNDDLPAGTLKSILSKAGLEKK